MSSSESSSDVESVVEEESLKEPSNPLARAQDVEDASTSRKKGKARQAVTIQEDGANKEEQPSGTLFMSFFYNRSHVPPRTD